MQASNLQTIFFQLPKNSKWGVLPADLNIKKLQDFPGCRNNLRAYLTQPSTQKSIFKAFVKKKCFKFLNSTLDVAFSYIFLLNVGQTAIKRLESSNKEDFSTEQ